MKIGKWVLLGLVLLPLAELVTYTIVAAAIGGYGATVLVLSTSAIGAWMLWRNGPAWLQTGRDLLAGRLSATAARELPLLPAAVAVLLAVPGFLTDIAALALLTPPVRARLDTWLGTVAPHRPGPGAGAGFRRSPGGVVDLEPDEWQRLPDPEPRKSRSRRRKS